MSPKMFLGNCLALALPLFALVLSGCDGRIDYNAVATHQPAFKQIVRSDQTDVDRAQHLDDENGVPYLKIVGVGRQRHPAWIALYALAYAGEEVYEPKLAGLQSDRKFAAALTWLEKNLVRDPSGLWVWKYGFGSTYNDITIKAPWSSAFAQATGIQAFLAAYRRTGEIKYLDLANRAAQSLFVPLSKGGFLFESKGDIWFEEIPAPTENPSHILNGHMRVLLALRELADATGDTVVTEWLNRGTETLLRWLPRYDAGYWLRYDLNPRKQDLLFRLVNPYGYPSHPLAVDRISLRDPVSGADVSVDIGSQGDSEGSARIAGTDWGQPEVIEGRTARRLASAALQGRPDEASAPHSYFYQTLPGRWASNLRDQWYELILEYYDDAATNIAVQQRTISPGVMFRDMRDGDLHLTGAGQWRKWVVPVRPSDLGYWVGKSYAEKHLSYLQRIADYDQRFRPWVDAAREYLSRASDTIKNGELVLPAPVVLPKQTPMLPIYSIDDKGVIRQHAPDSRSKLTALHMYDPRYGEGKPVYSPYIIASQLLEGVRFSGAIENGASYSKLRRDQISPQPALDWLLAPGNSLSVGDASLYLYPFNNAYNDVETNAPWSSAFGQAYVLKALGYAAERGLAEPGMTANAVNRAARGFAIPIAEGGIASRDKGGMVWYEEVPNSTHVLNAHLVSISELAHAADCCSKGGIRELADDGLKSLRDHLWLFDAGYWLKYDQNPKKELLLQLDWMEGDASPEIDEVLLENPRSGHFVRLDVGAPLDAEGGVRLSGADWQESKLVDGRTVRAFGDGYKARRDSVQGGTRHNVFLILSLPDKEFRDYFDVPTHRLVIRYRDVAKGRMALKVQAINEGNQLSFVPLRRGVWTLDGDQGWKEVVFEIRPQEMGWYKGGDYQRYEVEQIRRIADLTGDWFFSQYAGRHGYFLERQQGGKPVIAAAPPVDSHVDMSIVAASDTYAGYGFENSLDRDAADDYTAGIEDRPAFVVLAFDRPRMLSGLRFQWESDENHPGRLLVSRADSGNTAGQKLAELDSIQGVVSTLRLDHPTEVDRIRIDFSDFRGQNRILLRQIETIVGGS